MKKTTRLFLLLSITLIHAGHAQGVDEKVVKLSKPYDSISQLGKYWYDSAFYEEARQQQAFEFATFNYTSDEHLVTGFICRPKSIHKTNDQFPVIIFNRGGTGNYSKLSEENFPGFYRLARSGFIVVGSNYRFVGKNGSIDQLGGDDINDVVNLYNLMLEQPYIDKKNIFMMGVSRGGLMTYKSVTRVNVNAAAVLAGISNFFSHSQKRPVFVEGWNDLSEENNYKGLKNVLPDFEKNKDQYLTERSPVEWADKIDCPLLILHSRQDGFVHADQAFEMAFRLQELKKSYQLKIYEEKSHSLPFQYFDSYDEVISFFQKHLK